MRKYVDREVARRIIDSKRSKEQMLRMFDQISSADVVEVVLCKDCVKCGFCGDETNLEIMGFNGFCSRAERKKE